MNKKYIAPIAIVAIAGSLVIWKTTGGRDEKSSQEVKTRTFEKRVAPPTSNNGALVTGPATPRKKERAPHDNPDLVAKYGDARTNLSKHVTENMVGLLEDVMAMADMANSGKFRGGFGGNRGGLRNSLGSAYDQLNLDEDQLAKASELQKDFEKRQMDTAKEAITKLKQNPVPLMSLMLASDAMAQGKMSEEEFKTIQQETAADLEGVMNPLDRNNFKGGKALEDAAFTRSLTQILNPEQAAILQTSLDSQAAEPEKHESGIAQMQPMELEKAEKAVDSGKKITTGIKTMMEGLGSMQDLGEMTNPE